MEKKISLPSGKCVEIMRDESCENPRKDTDYMGLLVTWHRRYDFTDKKVPMNIRDINPRALIDKITAMGGIALPVWGYQHGRMAVKAGERTYPFDDAWDSGLLGVIYASAEAIHGWMEGDKEAATRELVQEIETLNDWLSGECYGYRINDVVDESGVIEEVDSCYGFIGEVKTNGMIEQMDLDDADKEALKAAL